MTPAEKDLWEKAEQAVWHYHTIHGVFPEKIGVHYQRTGFAYRHIVIAVLPRIPVTCIETTPLPITIERHIVPFAPVAGEMIKKRIWN